MKVSILFIISLLLLVSVTHSQDFELNLFVPKTDFIAAEPIIATGEITNVSNQPQKLLFGESGFTTYFHVERVDGVQRKECPREFICGMQYRTVNIPPGWSDYKMRDITQDVLCGDGPGVYASLFPPNH